MSRRQKKTVILISDNSNKIHWVGARVINKVAGTDRHYVTINKARWHVKHNRATDEWEGHGMWTCDVFPIFRPSSGWSA